MTTTDPQWYTDAVADPASAGWAAHIEECVRWLAAPAAAGGPDGSYIMQAALAAFALHVHRGGGVGVWTYRYDLLDVAVVVILGQPGEEAPTTMEEARARIVVQAQEIERLRAEAATIRPLIDRIRQRLDPKLSDERTLLRAYCVVYAALSDDPDWQGDGVECDECAEEA